MSRNSWLAGRVALAVALMVSFYVLALSISGGLLWLAYVDLTRARHPAARLILFCVVGAGSVLWAIVPRRDRFTPPGPRVTADGQPDLFGVINEVAAATSQAIPEEVYLLNDVNAFVAQRGGLMGVGGRRVMGLGLPLMQALTVDEFKGVLAHEFGHYHSGDVALGPWIYKTQTAMVRTIVQLGENVLRFVFIGFATVFMRVTQAVSRRQEFIADELAARLVGPAAMASGLRKVGVASVAYHNYWYGELVPVLRAGYRPPVMAGFGRYAASPTLLPVFADVGRQQEEARKTDPYDTHPSLADRVAALQRQPPHSGSDARPAAALLRDVEACERELFRTLSRDLADLKPLDWSAVSERVYLPIWTARIKEHGALLRDFTIGRPPGTAADLARLGRAIEPAADEASQQGLAWQLIVAGFALAMRHVGWTAEALPGEEIVLRRGAETLRPFSELNAIVNGSATLEGWQDRCAVLGVGAIALGVEPVVAGGSLHG